MTSKHAMYSGCIKIGASEGMLHYFEKPIFPQMVQNPREQLYGLHGSVAGC